jgi:hypothetical protein
LAGETNFTISGALTSQSATGELLFPKTISLTAYSSLVFTAVCLINTAFHLWIKGETLPTAVCWGLRVGLEITIVLTALYAHSTHVHLASQNSEHEQRWRAAMAELKEIRLALSQTERKESSRAKLKSGPLHEMRALMKSSRKELTAKFFKLCPSLLIFILSFPAAIILDFLLYGLGFWTLLSHALGA